MKKTRLILVLCAALAAGACNNNKTASTGSADSSKALVAQGPAVDAKEEALKKVKIDNTKDPVCDMPLPHGPGDTAMVNGKVLGFCSSECKADYLKEPAKYTVK